jgi:hypothetical protein
MTDPKVNSKSPNSRIFPRATFSCLLVATILLCGCAAHKRPLIPWSAAILVKPIALPVASLVAPDPLDGAPDLQVELTAPPRLAVARVVIPRPRASAPPIHGVDKNGEGELILAPLLSPEETLNAQREANQDISQAEQNLTSTRGRNLNAMQADLASKVRGFIADAKDAGRTGDWDRARSLARKAQVLSQEFASDR